MRTSAYFYGDVMMQEQITTPNSKKSRFRKNYTILMIISIVLCIAVIGVSIAAVVQNNRLSSEIALLRTELSAQNALIVEQRDTIDRNKSSLDSALVEISDNKSEIEKYRKLIKTLETTNAEQEELISSLTTPLNGRDEKTPEPTEEKVAYLTFDDGPSEHTEEILNILTEKDAVATFFVKHNGKYIDKLEPILKQGSALAMHTYSHDYKQIYSSVDAYFADLKQIQDVIFEKTGVTPTIMRLPGGSSNQISKQYCKGVVTQIVERLNAEGYIYFDWNVDSRDASTDKDKSAEALLNNIKNSCKDKRVINILMHDTNDKKSTVEALPQIIDYLREEGYIFMTLSPNSTLIQHTVAN